MPVSFGQPNIRQPDPFASFLEGLGQSLPAFLKQKSDQSKFNAVAQTITPEMEANNPFLKTAKASRDLPTLLKALEGGPRFTPQEAGIKLPPTLPLPPMEQQKADLAYSQSPEMKALSLPPVENLSAIETENPLLTQMMPLPELKQLSDIQASGKKSDTQMLLEKMREDAAMARTEKNIQGREELQAKKPSSIYGKIDPSKYTPESLTMFQQSLQSGQPDYTVLKPNDVMGVPKQTLRFYAENAVATGNIQPPNFGFGKTAAALRLEFMNEVGKVAGEKGIKPQDLNLNKSDLKAYQSALMDISKFNNRVVNFEATANKNLDLALSLSKNVPRTGSPLANRYDLWVKGQLKGDPATLAYQNAIYTAATEYAKVVTGQTTGAAVTDAARKEANRILNASFSEEDLQAVSQVMRQEMRNRITSLNETIQNTRSLISQVGTDQGISDQGGGRTQGQVGGVTADQLLKKHGYQ